MSCSVPGIRKLHSLGQIWPTACFCKVSYWATAMPIHLCTISGCFCADSRVEQLEQRPHGPQSLKHNSCALFRKRSLTLLERFIPPSCHGTAGFAGSRPGAIKGISFRLMLWLRLYSPRAPVSSGSPVRKWESEAWKRGKSRMC